MPNNIALAKKYSGLLDEVYKQEAKTGVLEASGAMVRAGNNAHEIMVPKFSMDGLGDYSRSTGYAAGDVTLEWETKAFNYERGRMFSVDDMDNEESQEIAFGRLAGEFVRTRTVPELDAFRFAELASTAGIGTDTGALSSGTGASVIGALRKATFTMDEAEVGDTERYLFITPTLYGMIEDMDTTKSRAVLSRFAGIIQVPQTRFYSAITLYDGKTAGQEAGGFIKRAADATAVPAVEAGKNINFMVVHKPAVIIYSKHVVSKIIAPGENQTADAWKYGYRSYGITKVFDNKKAGIYAHFDTT
jgi:hypothetical protein